MTGKLAPYDPAEDLRSAEAIAVFLTEAFKTEDDSGHRQCPGRRTLGAA